MTQGAIANPPQAIELQRALKRAELDARRKEFPLRLSIERATGAPGA